MTKARRSWQTQIAACLAIRIYITSLREGEIEEIVLLGESSREIVYVLASETRRVFMAFEHL